jgi:predicted HTH transcriptional regulator
VEGRQIEFKHYKDISDPNHIPLIMKYIAAFLNSEGGKFYIGIDDSSYVYGAKFKQSEYDKLLLNIDR